MLSIAIGTTDILDRTDDLDRSSFVINDSGNPVDTYFFLAPNSTLRESRLTTNLNFVGMVDFWFGRLSNFFWRDCCVCCSFCCFSGVLLWLGLPHFNEQCPPR